MRTVPHEAVDAIDERRRVTAQRFALRLVDAEVFEGTPHLVDHGDLRTDLNEEHRFADHGCAGARDSRRAEHAAEDRREEVGFGFPRGLLRLGDLDRERFDERGELTVELVGVVVHRREHADLLLERVRDQLVATHLLCEREQAVGRRGVLAAIAGFEDLQRFERGAQRAEVLVERLARRTQLSELLIRSTDLSLEVDDLHRELLDLVEALHGAVATEEERGQRETRQRGEERRGIEIRLRGGRVAALRDPAGQSVRSLRLEPAVIGNLDPDGGRDRLPVPLAALPQHLTDAVLAIEDQRFLEHHGLDVRRIGGALVANLRAGRVVQGGSTLTQQLVKNLYLSRERSWYRKLQEAPLAIMLEVRRSKPEILEAYLNEVYLGQAGGRAIHGVGRAAEHYFGKPAQRLDVHESALLAGLLRGPSLYAPARDPDAALARRNVVLAQMRELGRLTDAEYEVAAARPLDVVGDREIPRATRYFVDSITPGLRQRYEPAQLKKGGLSIYTTLDLRLQRLGERVLSEGLAQLEKSKPALVREGAPLQGALVALDPRSGHLLAAVGGRDYGSTQFNRALDARRQPGSVFKPVAALAAITLEPDAPVFTLATLIEDAPVTLETPEGDWEPGNHDREFRGLVTLREAVEHSLNVPMIRLSMEIGPRRIVRAARRLGIESRLRGVPSLVLGTSEVTLLEMTRAYGVLAAEGWRADLRDVLAVYEPSGTALEEIATSGRHTIDPAEAYVVTSVLQGVVNRGTGFGVRARGFAGPVAGKTGTTDEYRDAWFIGYTPELAVGVWVGFDDGEPLRHSGATAALPIFTEFLKGAVGSRGGRDFRVPVGVETVQVVAAEGQPSGLRCDGEPEVFLDGTAPNGDCGSWNWLARRPFEKWWEEEEAVSAPPPDEPKRHRRSRFLRWINPFSRVNR